MIEDMSDDSFGKLSRELLRGFFSTMGVFPFHISVNGMEFEISMHPVSVTAVNSQNDEYALLFQDILSRKDVHPQPDKLEFCNQVAYVVKSTVHEHVMPRNSQMKCRKFINVLVEVSLFLGLFGKIILILWELPGPAFMFAFFYNIQILCSCAGINMVISSSTATFVFVFLPVMAYCLFFPNLVMIYINEYISSISDAIRGRNKTIWATAQELIMKAYRILGFKNDRRHIFEMGQWYDLFAGVFTFVFILVLLLQVFGGAPANALSVLVLIFAFFIPVIKYFIITALYLVHSVLAMIPKFRRNYVNENLNDPFLNGIYLKTMHYEEYFKFSNDDSPYKWRYILGLIFSKPTASICVSVILFIYFIATFDIDAPHVFALIAFLVFVLPIATMVQFPWFIIHHSRESAFDDEGHKMEGKKLAGDFQLTTQWAMDSVKWGKEHSLLRGLSIILNACSILVLIAAILMASAFKIETVMLDKASTPSNAQLYSLPDNFRETENPICHVFAKGLTAEQIVALGYMAYRVNLTDGLYDAVIDEYFDGIPIDILETGFTGVGQSYMRHFYIDSIKLHVFAVRGTSNGIDALADVELWFSSVVLNVVVPFTILAQRFSPAWVEYMGTIMSLPRYVLNDFSIIVSYVKELEEFISSVKLQDDEDALIVGHSLGGGLAKILSLRTHYQAAAISGPGVSAFSNHYGDSKADLLMGSFMDIVPDQDIVASVDFAKGSKFQVPCTSGMFQCHPVLRTLCQIGVMCGNRHESYCRKFYTDKEIQHMKNLGLPVII